MRGIGKLFSSGWWFIGMARPDLIWPECILDQLNIKSSTHWFLPSTEVWNRLSQQMLDNPKPDIVVLLAIVLLLWIWQCSVIVECQPCKYLQTLEHSQSGRLHDVPYVKTKFLHILPWWLNMTSMENISVCPIFFGNWWKVWSSPIPTKKRRLTTGGTSNVGPPPDSFSTAWGF
jgi:hypothetical protein